jgi:hypothetical protein
MRQKGDKKNNDKVHNRGPIIRTLLHGKFLGKFRLNFSLKMLEKFGIFRGEKVLITGFLLRKIRRKILFRKICPWIHLPPVRKTLNRWFPPSFRRSRHTHPSLSSPKGKPEKTIIEITFIAGKPEKTIIEIFF